MNRLRSWLMALDKKKVPIPQNGVDYRGKVVLAPMVRSGELPSRLLALKYGADLVWGPETIDKSMIGTTRRVNTVANTIDFTRPGSDANKADEEGAREHVIYRLHSFKERGKLIFQLGTASPESAVQAAELVAADVAGIDVNAGCPKPFSTLGGMGAALLKKPDHLADILTALVQRIGNKFEIGISVKIRLLETREETASLVEKLCKTGITGLTVHCRTTPMRPRERAIRDQLQIIGDICRRAGVACLINGDVMDRDDALLLAKQYQVDGGMIATAAEKNPSCFRSREAGGALPWREVATEYVKQALQVYNKWGNTKFLLAQLVPGKTEVGKQLFKCKTYSHLCELFDLSSQQIQAAVVDSALGLDENRESKAQRKKTRRGQCHVDVDANSKLQSNTQLSAAGSNTAAASTVAG